MAARQSRESSGLSLASVSSRRNSLDSIVTGPPPSLVNSEGGSTLSDAESAESESAPPLREYTLESSEEAARAEETGDMPPAPSEASSSSLQSASTSQAAVTDVELASRGLHSAHLDETDCFFGPAQELLADMVMACADDVMPAYAAKPTAPTEMPHTSKQSSATAENGRHNFAISMWLKDDGDALHYRLSPATL